MMQIVQELCRRPGLNKCGFEMPTIYIPNPQKVRMFACFVLLWWTGKGMRVEWKFASYSVWALHIWFVVTAEISYARGEGIQISLSTSQLLSEQ